MTSFLTSALHASPRNDAGPAAARGRATQLLRALDIDPGTDPLAAVAARLPTMAPDEIWLTVSVLTGHLPTARETRSAVRLLHRDGAHALLQQIGATASSRTSVDVVTGEVLVDLSEPVCPTNELGAGLVAEQLARIWSATKQMRGVRWADDGRSLVSVQAAGQPDGGSMSLIPWHSTLVVVRPPTDADVASRLQALAMNSRSRTSAVGFGLPAITCFDRTEGEAAGTAHALSAVRHLAQVVAVSPVAREEYAGWRQMVNTLDLPGPAIDEISLPDEPLPLTHDGARPDEALDASPLPLVVSTGGLGARGNQLLVLRSAHTLWTSGLMFQLVLVGHDCDPTPGLARRIDELCAAGFPVSVVRRLDASATARTFAKARCVIDVPQHDPMGLHTRIARSLGVPVVTGRGQPETAIFRGGVADPDDSTALAEAIRPLLEEPAVRRSAQQVPVSRTWQAYADELWSAAVESAPATAGAR